VPPGGPRGTPVRAAGLVALDLRQQWAPRPSRADLLNTAMSAEKP
jgi:hypothetical protein